MKTNGYILFSEPMVRAILREQNPKAQTRRVARPQPPAGMEIRAKNGRFHVYSENPLADPKTGSPWGFEIKPKFKPGQVLWVRETWRFCTDANSFCYKASQPYISDHCRKYASVCAESPKWRAAVHMPREAARLFLRIKTVKAQQVQDITEAEAKAEGVTRIFDHLTKEEYDKWNAMTSFQKPQNEHSYNNYLWHGRFRHGEGNKHAAWPYQYSGYDSARDSFSSLWELLNAQQGYGWGGNPWVWAYEFERVKEDDA
jgi:hypothetical protein